MVNILVQFPTLGRPDQFLEVFQLYLDKCTGEHQVVFNIICDADDLSMNNPAITRKIEQMVYARQSNDSDHYGPFYPLYDIFFDKGTDKISAINSHIKPDHFDVIVCASDDMIPGDYWDDAIALDFEKHFPDFDGCISYADGHNPVGTLITFSIMGVELYKHFGYIYHPDYKSLYCDNEFTDIVNDMGKVAYVDNVMFRHEHYAEEGNRNSGNLDFAARKTLKFAGRDQVVYNKRKAMGFPKERVTND